MYKKIFIILFLLITAFAGVLWAEKSLERIANEKGVEGESLFNEGKFLEAASSFEIAIAKLKEAAKKEGIPLDNEKISKWLENTFQGYFQGKDFDNAIRILDERLKLDPDNYKLINNKAIILKKYLNRIDEAIIVLQTYNNKKRSFKVEKKIAGYCVDNEDYQNALDWYQKAYELKQDSGVIKNIAVILYKYLGRNEDAIKAYEDYISTNPPKSAIISTYKNMGALYEDMNNYTKANFYFEKALELKYDPNINLKLISSYFDRDLYDKCSEKIEQLLKNKPGNIDAIYYRALVKYNQEDKVRAKENFKKLLGTKYDKSAKGWIESIESE